MSLDDRNSRDKSMSADENVREEGDLDSSYG